MRNVPGTILSAEETDYMFCCISISVRWIGGEKKIFQFLWWTLFMSMK